MRTRITEMLGIDVPIVQAPMGYIARSQLASAVSEAGGLGIVETSSGRWDEVRAEMEAMPALTDRPWGVNIAGLFVRDAALLEAVIGVVVDAGVRFATTSAGDPARLVPPLKAAGITVFHVVPTVRGALKAVEAGADGLVVEGIEGGGFKNADGASTMVLLPQVAASVDVPLIAAGGICDGVSMAAALTLGADGVQMGTRMLTSAESPVHPNWKSAVLAAAETDTVVVNRFVRPAMRTLRTELSSEAERQSPAPSLTLDGIRALYFGGEMNAAYAMSGQVAGRVTEVLPVRRILETTWSDCQARLREMGARAAD